MLGALVRVMNTFEINTKVDTSADTLQDFDFTALRDLRALTDKLAIRPSNDTQIVRAPKSTPTNA